MTYYKTIKSIFSGASFAVCVLAIGASNASETEVVYPKKPFRAEIQIVADGQTTPAVLYGEGQFMRLEMTANGKPMVQIIDMKKDEALMLVDMGGQKTAMRLQTESAFDRFALSTSSLGPVTGSKKIAGYQCNTYVVKESTVCLTSDNIALESIASNGTMRVSSLKMGDQEQSLFEVPAGYQVVDMGALMGGIDPSVFDSEDGILGEIFNQTGQNPGSDIFGDINKIIDAEGDEAAGNAALDAMLGQMGLPKGMLSSDDTTAGVLIEGIDQELDLSDADKVKAAAMMQENQRMMEIIQREGIAGLLRDAGVSESTIKDAERSQEKLGKMVQAHADKNKDQIEAGIASTPVASNAVDLEAELNALNKRAEALANDGDVSDADKARIQKDATEMLQRILGGLPQE